MTNLLVTAMAKKHVSLSSLPELACTGDKCFKNISKTVFTAMAKKHVSSFNLACTLGMFDTNSYKMTILLFHKSFLK